MDKLQKAVINLHQAIEEAGCQNLDIKLYFEKFPNLNVIQFEDSPTGKSQIRFVRGDADKDRCPHH